MRGLGAWPFAARSALAGVSTGDTTPAATTSAPAPVTVPATEPEPARPSGGFAGLGRSLAKLGAACALAATMGFAAHAGQVGSQVGAVRHPEPVVGVKLDLRPELIHSAVVSTIAEQDRRSKLFTLPPDPTRSEPVAAERNMFDPRPLSVVSSQAMSRVLQIIQADPRARERLLYSGGTIGLADLSLAQRNQVTALVLEAFGAYESIGEILRRAGMDPENDAARAKLDTDIDFIVDPTVPGATAWVSLGRTDHVGRVSLVVTWDGQALPGVQDTHARGFEASLEYHLEY